MSYFMTREKRIVVLGQRNEKRNEIKLNEKSILILKYDVIVDQKV